MELFKRGKMMGQEREQESEQERKQERRHLGMSGRMLLFLLPPMLLNLVTGECATLYADGRGDALCGLRLLQSAFLHG